MTQDIWKYAVVSVVSAAAGSAVTYFVIRKRVDRAYSELAADEIRQVKERYALLRKEGKYADPATAVKAYEMRESELHEAVQYAKKAAAYQAEEEVEEASEVLEEKIEAAEEVETAVRNDSPSPLVRPELYVDEPKVHHIFDQEEPIDTAVIEIQGPVDKAKPYLISAEEYLDDESTDSKYSKITITYWETDDTLCDEREAIIPDIEGTVGAINLHRFDENGETSDVIYVRNERLKADYEVVREKASYSVVILGMREFDARDSKLPIRKMRGYDE